MDIITVSRICTTWGKVLSVSEEESCMPAVSIILLQASYLYLLWDNPVVDAVLGGGGGGGVLNV
jgi:hypothetical protein